MGDKLITFGMCSLVAAAFIGSGDGSYLAEVVAGGMARGWPSRKRVDRIVHLKRRPARQKRVEYAAWTVSWILAHASLFVPVFFLGGVFWLFRQKTKTGS